MTVDELELRRLRAEFAESALAAAEKEAVEFAKERQEFMEDSLEESVTDTGSDEPVGEQVVFRPTTQLENRTEEMVFDGPALSNYGPSEEDVLPGRSGGGFTLPYTIYFADGATLTIPESDVLADFKATMTNWSIKFPVYEGVMDQTFSFVEDTDRFPGDPDQTAYLLPVIRDEIRVSSGGIFEEILKCNNGSPVVMLNEIG